MKQHKITPEQLLKILISESEAIQDVNKTIKKSVTDLNYIITEKLKHPININPKNLEHHLSVLYSTLNKNNESQKQFLIHFEKAIQKGKKNDIWIHFVLGMAISFLVISIYFNYNLNIKKEELKTNQDFLQRFFIENPSSKKTFDEWRKEYYQNL